MFKKTALAMGFGLALGLSGQVFAADSIIFDPDGTKVANGDTLVGAFDWSPGSTLADESVPTAEGDTFNTYSHAALAGYLDKDGDPAGAPTGLNTSFEITYISGFTETITNISTTGATLLNDGGDGLGGGNDTYSFQQTITLADADTQVVNFFKIYYDDLTDGSGQKASSLTGDGYGDGTLILDANVGVVSGNFTTTFKFIDVDNDGMFTQGVDTLTGFVLLDQSTNGDQWGGQLTVQGEGSTQLQADVTWYDSNFFKTDISQLVADLFFNTSNILPFKETNPSQGYNDGDDGTIGSIDPNVGTVNGLSGPDIVFQTDANNSFVTTVPEPNTTLLFGLGLLTLGLAARRRLKA